MGVHDSREGFRQAFAENYGALHRYVHRRLGADLADEIAAETFLTAYTRWDRFDGERAVRPWLYGIAANLIRHHYRSEERKLHAYARSGIEAVTDAGEDAAVRRLDAQARQWALAAALAALRREEREVLLLNAWAELTDEEIASALALPVGTVKSRLSRARQHVRTGLSDSRQEEDEMTTATGRSGR